VQITIAHLGRPVLKNIRKCKGLGRQGPRNPGYDRLGMLLKLGKQ